MLSNQSFSLHQRQNSTPGVNDVALKAPFLPANQHSFDGTHRQGLNLDQRVNPQQPYQPSMQDNENTNHGLYHQQNLRETQQHQQARPGQYQQQNHSVEHNNTSKHQSSTSMSNPINQADCLEYSGADFSALLGSANTSLYGFNQAVPPERPCTPPNQTFKGYLPTPTTTPFAQRSYTQQGTPSRTARSSPTRQHQDDMMRTPSATPMKRGSSCQSVFEDTRYGSPSIPSPPNTVPLSCSRVFEARPIPAPSFMNMSALKMNFPGSETYDSSNYSPMSNRVSPEMSSFQTSPELAHMDLFGDLDQNMPTFSSLNPHQSAMPASRSAVDLLSYSSPMKEEVPPRSQSISDIGLDLDFELIEDTGVSVDEIAAFILPPMPESEDGRYKCLFPGCRKKFGRKENIKSHVQTHLGDRQYRCNYCSKCFVRQHDLKRHSKIHSGVKPYPCACGNSFARHDALTRHRQRGMCIGAIEGFPKKEVRRGRPKKSHRPETEERLEKAARTRQRVLEKKGYASSMSGSSEYSLPSPPQDIDDMDTQGTIPFGDFNQTDPMSCGVSPAIFSYTPPPSPGYSTGNRPSPPHSHYSCTPKAGSHSPSIKRGSITSIPEETEGLIPSQTSPCKSPSSRYGTPPELELSSSSPVTSRIFDFDSSLETTASTSFLTRNSQSNNSTNTFDLPPLDNHDEQLFFESLTQGTSAAEFERAHALMMEKLECPFFSSDPWSSDLEEHNNPYFGGDYFD